MHVARESGHTPRLLVIDSAADITLKSLTAADHSYPDIQLLVAASLKGGEPWTCGVQDSPGGWAVNPEGLQTLYEAEAPVGFICLRRLSFKSERD